MQDSKAYRVIKILSAALGEFSYLPLPLSSFSWSSEHGFMWTLTFSKNPIGKNSSSVIRTNDFCSSRSMGWISWLLMFLDFFFSVEWWGLFFLPCLFLQWRDDGWMWLCFLGLRWVTRVHPSSSSLASSETSIGRLVSIKGPWVPLELH